MQQLGLNPEPFKNETTHSLRDPFPKNATTLTGVAPSNIGNQVSVAQINPVLWRCVSLVSSSIAGMPKSTDRQGAVRTLLKNPCRVENEYDFWLNGITRLCIDGNSAFYILRRAGHPVELIPALIQDVRRLENGKLIYALYTSIKVESSLSYRFPGLLTPIAQNFRAGAPLYPLVAFQDDVLHFKFAGSARPDFIVAPSPITSCAMGLIEERQAITDYQKRLLETPTPKNMFEFPEVQSVEEISTIINEWQKRVENNKGSDSIVPPKAKLVQAGFSNFDLSLLEALKFGTIDITRIYGVPLFLVSHHERNMGRSDANQSGQWNNFYRSGLKGNIEQIQAELKFKLGQEVIFDVSKFIQGSDEEIGKLARMYVGGGVMTANEFRRKFTDLPDHEDGNKLFQPAGVGMENDKKESLDNSEKEGDNEEDGENN